MNFDDFKLVLTHLDLKAESKKNEHDDDAKLRRFKDKWLFVCTMVMLYMVVAFLGYFIIVYQNHSQVGIAMNGIIAIVMALAGYYVRGKNN